MRYVLVSKVKPNKEQQELIDEWKEACSKVPREIWEAKEVQEYLANYLIVNVGAKKATKILEDIVKNNKEIVARKNPEARNAAFRIFGNVALNGLVFVAKKLAAKGIWKLFPNIMAGIVAAKVGIAFVATVATQIHHVVKYNKENKSSIYRSSKEALAIFEHRAELAEMRKSGKKFKRNTWENWRTDEKGRFYYDDFGEKIYESECETLKEKGLRERKEMKNKEMKEQKKESEKQKESGAQGENKRKPKKRWRVGPRGGKYWIDENDKKHYDFM